ncbi:MAG: 2Fe-2S iron-sulfur cluster-binding protein [Anaerolineae bacterium]|nr:2Fe-2S iron-sulfur cluster-binding protein [Anaerolineae bacterium]
MTTVRMVVDGQEILARAGQTILQACREHGIPIPTLCYDEHLQPLTACRMCVVEVEEHGLVLSCDTRVADGLVIWTQSPRVIAARRQYLETILSEHYGDCVSPCRMACPAGLDIQGYISLIKRGAYREAVELIKETLPLPAVIGRICPTPARRPAVGAWWTSLWRSVR